MIGKFLGSCENCSPPNPWYPIPEGRREPRRYRLFLPQHHLKLPLPPHNYLNVLKV